MPYCIGLLHVFAALWRNKRRLRGRDIPYLFPLTHSAPFSPKFPSTVDPRARHLLKLLLFPRLLSLCYIRILCLFLVQNAHTAGDAEPNVERRFVHFTSKFESSVFGFMFACCVCPHNWNNTEIETVLKRFYFSQNKTLQPWKVLAVLANHCRYPLFARQARGGGGATTCAWPRRSDCSTVVRYCNALLLEVTTRVTHCILPKK